MGTIKSEDPTIACIAAMLHRASSKLLSARSTVLSTCTPRVLLTQRRSIMVCCQPSSSGCCPPAPAAAKPVSELTDEGVRGVVQQYYGEELTTR